MSLAPLIQIINNLSVLIALSVISTFIIRHIEINSLKNKILQGLLYSFAVFFVITNPFVLDKGLIFDGRSIVISISTLFFGPITGFFPFLTGVVYRYYIGGSGAIIGILVIFFSYFIGIYAHNIYSKKKYTINPNLFYYMIELLVHIVMVLLMLNLPYDQKQKFFFNIAPIVISVYPLAGLLLAKILDTAIEYENNLFQTDNLRQEYLNTLNSIGDVVITIDLNGIIKYANFSALKFFSLKESDITKRKFTDIFHFIDTNNGEQILDTVNLVKNKKEKLHFTDNILLIANKNKYYVILTLSPILNKSKIIDGIIITFTDYTEKYLLNESFANSSKKYKTIFDNISDAILISDMEGRIVEINNIFLKLTGYKQEELIGQFAYAKNIFVNINDMQNLIQSVKFKNQELTHICQFRKANGEIFWGLQFATKIIYNDKEYVLTLTKDITEIKKLEESLNETLNNNKIIFDTIPDAIVITEIENGKIIIANDAIKNVTGFTKEEIIGKSTLELKLWWDPDERMKLLEELSKSNKIKDFKIFIRTKDNRKITGLMNAQIIYLSNKKYIFATVKDVTEFEKLQNELIESEKRFRSFFYMNPENILITRVKDGLIVEANDSLAELLNIPKNELIGKSVIDLNLWGNVEKRNDFISILRENGIVRRMPIEFNLPNNKKFLGVISAVIITIDGEEHILSVTYDLTDVVQLQNKIIEQNKELTFYNHLLETIINSTNDVMMYYLDAEYNIKVFSKSYKEFVKKVFGKDIEIGMNLKDFLHEERYNMVINRLKSIKNSPLRFTDNVPQRDENLYIEVIYSPVVIYEKIIGYTVFLVDVTEKIKSFNELQESEKKYKSLIDNLPGFVFRCKFNPTYDMVYLSERFTDITGYNIDDFLTQKLSFSNIITDTTTTFDDIVQILSSSNYYEDTYQIKTADDGYKWLYERSIPIRDENNNVIYLEGYIEDITEKYELQKKLSEQNASLANLNQELFKMNQELLFAKEKIEESDRLKTAFLNNLNHEIRTPMNGIIGFAELLQKTDILENDRIYYATVIQQSAYRLLNLVNQIIELSKIDTNQIEIFKNDISLYHFYTEIINRYKDKINNKNLYFITHYADELKGMMIYNDEQKLSSIVNNILDNAIKFTKEGYIKLTFTQENNFLVISIKDTGIGLKPEETTRIFDRFYQGSTEFNRGYEGSGLGLSLANEYIKLLNGSISVNSIYGEGSEFIIRIPLLAKTDELENTIMFETKQFNYKIPNNIPILVVDDDPFNNELLSDLLIGMYNAKIFKAYDGEQALEILRNNYNILLVFMDVKMPRMDGLTATREIRKFNKNVPIIGVSAYANFQDLKNAQEAGMNNYIAKPYTKEQIDKVISSIFKKN